MFCLAFEVDQKKQESKRKQTSCCIKNAQFDWFGYLIKSYGNDKNLRQVKKKYKSKFFNIPSFY